MQVVLRQPQRLPKVLHDALDRVGGNGPGQHRVLRPEVLVHPPDELVAEGAGKVEVDVRQHGHVLGDEPLQRETPAQRVHVADADEVARQQRDGRPAPLARRPLLQRRLRVGQPVLLHELLGQQRDLPVEQQEACQPVPAEQPELLVQALRHLRWHRAVAAHGGLVAEAAQVALRGVPLRHGGLRQGVAQPRGQVEGALLRDVQCVEHGVRPFIEELGHSCGVLQVEVVVGPQVGQGAVERGVEPRRYQRVLEPRPLRRMVVDVVGGHDGQAGLSRESRQQPVAQRVPVQEVLVQLHVHPIAPEPRCVVAQQRAGVVEPGCQNQPCYGAVAPAGE